MPRPSKFIGLVRSHGLRPTESSPYSTRLGPYKWSLEPRFGKKHEALLKQIVGPSEQTKSLSSARLPMPRSTLDSKSLRTSSYVRIGVWRTEGYPRQQRLEAIVHAEYALQAPTDLNPDAFRSWYEAPPSPMVMTLRLLDIHLQEDAGTPEYVHPQDEDALLEYIAEALVHQLLVHMSDLSPAIYDFNDAIGGGVWLKKLIRIELQGDKSRNHIRAVIRHAESTVREWSDNSFPQYEVEEWLDIEDGLDLRHTPPDAAFEDAISQLVTNRKSAAKPKRARPPPNATHHLLICVDPALRLIGDHVINLASMASMQCRAADAAHGSDEWSEIDYERRLQAMKDSPDHAPLKWLLLVDESTHVFAATPCSDSQPDLAAVTMFLETAWRGEFGMLQGPPERVSMAASYTDTQTRSRLAQWLALKGIGLAKPTSGFATPIHTGRLWCESAADLGPSDYSSERPARVSLQYVKEWTLAQLLAHHAASYFASPTGAVHRGTEKVDAGFYGSMSGIRVNEYLETLSLGEALPMLEQWSARCHPRFLHRS